MKTATGDWFYNSEEFQTYFNAGARSFVLKADSPHFTILAMSDRHLALMHKQRSEVLQRGLFDVFPGSAADPSEKNSAFSSLTRVIENKRTDELPLFKYKIYKEDIGVWETEYWTSINEPVFDSNGKVAYIIDTTANVTQQILGKRAVEETDKLKMAFEELNLSKQAAQLGTFNYHVKKNTLTWDDRCRELFGVSHTNPISYETDFVGGLYADDRERIITNINNLFTDISLKGDYDVEYRTVGAEDGRIRWVRAKGKVYFDSLDKPEQFIGMVLDITDQKRDEQRKNDFIGMVSHEMKTPLTSLSGYLQLLQNKIDKGDHLATGLLDKANKQIGRITNLINGFLNVSRLESGKIQIDRQRFDMAKLVEEAEEETRFLYNKHSIVFTPVEPTLVDADRDKIGQVISNLINNAVKYSAANTVVNVACVIIDDNAVVSIKDEGIGIKEEDKPRLFDRYYRVSESGNTASGFGIGLYLCYEIIQRHDGKIWVDSEVGKGSTFSFSLPVSASTG